jgi:glycosyltransferase involved in cell wall biosynthesis
VRVTFLCPHLRIAGGVRAILTHADRLARRGHEVRVVVPARRRRLFERREPSLAAPEWMPGLRASIEQVSRWTAEDLPDGDAVVATSWESAEPVASAPARCGAKFYLIQHYESLYHGSATRVDATYRLPLRKIVISTWLSQIMADRFASRSDVVVTPVDPCLFHRVSVDDDDGRVRVLMLHHEYPWKGVADGVEAMASLKQSHPAVRLVGFGVKPPPRPLYDEFFENVPQERLSWLYSRSAIYCCPSWDEGLGMPPMEAMACGAALCTYDNGGCRDYAFDEQTALVVPRRDVPALTRALVRLIEDRELRERIARQGRECIATRFDWDRASQQLEAILRGG